VVKLVSLFFFCLPIIALDTVPVLCAIKYFLACNNNNGDFRMEGFEEIQSRVVKKKGKNQ
jgi:hypothetical protein